MSGYQFINLSFVYNNNIIITDYDYNCRLLYRQAGAHQGSWKGIEFQTNNFCFCQESKYSVIFFR